MENNNQQPQYQPYQQYQVPQPQYQQPVYQQPQYQQQYQQPASTASVFALILGIASIAMPLLAVIRSVFFAFSGISGSSITSLAGFVCGIIAIVLGAREKKQPNGKLAKAGFICGIIGLALYGIAIVFLFFIGFAWSSYLLAR